MCDINLISGDLSSVYERTSDNLTNNNLLSTLLWCTRSRLLIKPNTRPRTVNVVCSSFPPWNDQYGLRNRSKVWTAYIFWRTFGLLHGKLLYESSCKNIWVKRGTKFFKLVILVGERGQRLKLGPCKSKVKKFSVPLWQTANMLLRLLNCIHKR